MLHLPSGLDQGPLLLVRAGGCSSTLRTKPGFTGALVATLYQKHETKQDEKLLHCVTFVLEGGLEPPRSFDPAV